MNQQVSDMNYWGWILVTPCGDLFHFTEAERKESGAAFGVRGGARNLEALVLTDLAALYLEDFQ